MLVPQWLDAVDAREKSELPDPRDIVPAASSVLETGHMQAQVYIPGAPDGKQLCLQPVICAALLGAAPAHPQLQSIRIGSDGMPGRMCQGWDSK